jgi:hypothetical protein
MRLHIDVLGWLHLVWGAFGLLTGFSLIILAVGARQAMVSMAVGAPGDAYGLGEQAAVAVLLTVGGALMAGGAVCAATGWFLRLLRGPARFAALLVSVPNLIFVPFGTALGVYTFWVLLNNDARRVFGHTQQPQ